jgi:electron transfer flavoprotein beta subunit
MNIFVCIKQVPDTEATIVPNGAGIDESAVQKWILNPYDEYAVEEAVQLKEGSGGAELVAVSLGPERAKSAFQTALAMGADRGIHIVSDEAYDPAQTAEALAAAIRADGEPTIVFTGVLAIDDYACQVHLRLAQRLHASAAVNVTAFQWTGDGAEVTRTGGGGAQEKIFLRPPAVVAVTKDINKPRYPTLPNIMKAKKKEIRRLTPADVGLDGDAGTMGITAMEAPQEVSGGRILEGDHSATAAELAGLLRDEARVV